MTKYALNKYGMAQSTVHEAYSFACPVLSLVEAVDCVLRGGVVVYPTETFFAIGCDACHGAAVARVYQAKHRSVQLPLPAIVPTMGFIAAVAQMEVEQEAFVTGLAQKFWPGPLTLLLPALPHIPPMVTGGTGRIALRVSPHPVPQALSAALSGALVSSSANISGEAAVTSAMALSPTLLSAVDGLVLDGPSPAGGAPSSLIHLVPSHAGFTLHVLREGAISIEQLQMAGYSVQ